MATTGKTFERTSESPRLHVGERLRILVAHREILANLVRKELKVKYAASALGAVWSLLNPLVYLAVRTAWIGFRRDEVTKRRPDGSTYAASRSVRVSRKSGKEI